MRTPGDRRSAQFLSDVWSHVWVTHGCEVSTTIPVLQMRDSRTWGHGHSAGDLNRNSNPHVYIVSPSFYKGLEGTAQPLAPHLHHKATARRIGLHKFHTRPVLMRLLYLSRRNQDGEPYSKIKIGAVTFNDLAQFPPPLIGRKRREGRQRNDERKERGKEENVPGCGW